MINTLDMKKLKVRGLHYNKYNNSAEIIFRDVLISVFINSETGDLDVTVDKMSQNGEFDDNIEWVTCSPLDKNGNNTGIVNDDVYRRAEEYVRYFLKQEFLRERRYVKA